MGLCRQRSSEYLRELLNKKGKRNQTALENAIKNKNQISSIKIAKSLMLCPEQEKNWKLLLQTLKSAKYDKKKEWILMIGELMEETHEDVKAKLLDVVNQYRQLSVIMMSQKAETN